MFIEGDGIVYPQEVMEEFKLDCDEDALKSKFLLLEIFEYREESALRLSEFTGWHDCLNVSIYKNGKLIGDNC